MKKTEIKEIIEKNFDEKIKQAETRIKDNLNDTINNYIERLTDFYMEYAELDNYTKHYIQEDTALIAAEYIAALENGLHDFFIRLQKDDLFNRAERKKATEELKQYYSDGCKDNQIHDILMELLAFEDYAELIPLYFGERKTIQEIADSLSIENRTVNRAKQKILDQYINLKKRITNP